MQTFSKFDNFFSVLIIKIQKIDRKKFVKLFYSKSLPKFLITQASDPVTSVDLGGMALRAWKKFGWLAQANRHGGYLEV